MSLKCHVSSVQFMCSRIPDKSPGPCPCQRTSFACPPTVGAALCFAQWCGCSLTSSQWNRHRTSGSVCHIYARSDIKIKGRPWFEANNEWCGYRMRPTVKCFSKCSEWKSCNAAWNVARTSMKLHSSQSNDSLCLGAMPCTPAYLDPCAHNRT